MIVRLVVHGDLFLTDSTHELALHMTARRIGQRKCLPENVAHVAEKPYSTEKNRRVTLTMVQEKLCEAVVLSGKLRQPVFRRVLMLFYFFPLEVQFAEDILSILVSSLSRLRQIIYRLSDILFHDFSPEVLLARR